MDIRRDIAALAAALAWPVVALILAVRCRSAIGKVLRALPDRVSSISAAGFKVDFAVAT